jgi:hypothetical protein
MVLHAIIAIPHYDWPRDCDFDKTNPLEPDDILVLAL